MITTQAALKANAIDLLAESMGSDDPEMLIDIIDTFLTDASQLVQRLKLAQVQNDDTQLFRASHTLKSSSAVLGAEALSRLAEDLELAMRHQNAMLDRARQVDLITAAFAAAASELHEHRVHLAAKI